MEYFWKCATLSLVAVVLIAQLRQQKDMGALLGMAACAMVLLGALRLFEPVVTLFRDLEELAGLDGNSLKILCKATGVGLAAEMAGCICADSGNGALAKAMRLLGTAAMLCLSIPMVEKLMGFVQEMVGAS